MSISLKLKRNKAVAENKTTATEALTTELGKTQAGEPRIATYADDGDGVGILFGISAGDGSYAIFDNHFKTIDGETIVGDGNIDLRSAIDAIDAKVGSNDYSGATYISKEENTTDALMQLDTEVKATNDNIAIGQEAIRQFSRNVTTLSGEVASISGSLGTYATKEDLSDYATKDDLEGYLPLAGGTLTGSTYIGDNPAKQISLNCSEKDSTPYITISNNLQIANIYPSRIEVGATDGGGMTLRGEGITIPNKTSSDLLNAGGSTTPISNIVTQVTAAIVDGAPATLDTLNELATALGDDPNFATTVTNQIAQKADIDHTHVLSAITDLHDTWESALKANPVLVNNAVALTNQDLNSYSGTSQCGYYYAAGGNTVTNKPSNVDAFSMVVLRGGSGVVSQVLIHGQQNNMYTRYYITGSWTGWVRFARTSDLTWASITGKPSTFAPSAHNHAISDVTDLQSTLNGKANTNHTHSISEVTDKQALTIQTNGTTRGVYSGTSAVTVNITASDVGAATVDHTHKEFLTLASADTRYVNASGDTINGDLTVQDLVVNTIKAANGASATTFFTTDGTKQEIAALTDEDLAGILV